MSARWDRLQPVVSLNAESGSEDPDLRRWLIPAALSVSLPQKRAVEPLRVGGHERAELAIPGVLLRPAGVREVVLRRVPADGAHDLVRVVVAGDHDRADETGRLRLLLPLPLLALRPHGVPLARAASATHYTALQT